MWMELFGCFGFGDGIDLCVFFLFLSQAILFSRLLEYSGVLFLFKSE